MIIPLVETWRGMSCKDVFSGDFIVEWEWRGDFPHDEIFESGYFFGESVQIGWVIAEGVANDAETVGHFCLI
jgi:hypothetical protein